MTDLATNNYQSVVAVAATEGLEDIFDVRELDASQGANRVSDRSLVREQDANWLSVEDVSERLGISVRAVQKRLKKGSLRGRKEKTATGEKWLIDGNELDASQDANRVLDAPLVREQDANRHELDASNIVVSDNLIRELQAKLEAATYRIGYLEAQLESEREQVKLLTDSQHKPGWWARFKKWCAGQ